MTNQRKKDYIANTIGGIIYASSSAILPLVVILLAGSEWGGIFSIAFTISQTVGVIGNFEMRTFQVTDNGTYAFQDYFLSRIYTSVIMIAVSLIWIVSSGYKQEKALLVGMLCVYRLSDVIGDVIEAYYQQQDKLYISSILLSLRSGIPTLFFAGTLIITNNLIYGAFMLMIISVFLLGLLDFGKLCLKDSVKFTGGKNRNVIELLMVCLPLFIGSFLSTYIINAPKYAIDKYLSAEIQSYYGIIFMPSFVINLISAFLFKPLLLDIASNWKRREVRTIHLIIIKMSICIAIITFISVILGKLIGIPVLSYVYGVPDIAQYSWQFIIILLGGGLNAYCMFLYHILTTMRKQNYVLFAYLTVFIEAAVMSNIMVMRYNLAGAAITYLINCTVLAVLFLIGVKREI